MLSVDRVLSSSETVSSMSVSASESDAASFIKVEVDGSRTVVVVVVVVVIERRTVSASNRLARRTFVVLARRGEVRRF